MIDDDSLRHCGIPTTALWVGVAGSRSLNATSTTSLRSESSPAGDDNAARAMIDDRRVAEALPEPDDRAVDWSCRLEVPQCHLNNVPPP